MRLRSWIAVAALSVVAPATLHYYGAWRRGDDIYIPRVGTVYRFPCSGYQLQTRDYTTTQAFAVIDGAARAARSNAKGRVTDLVDAVFDRVLESVRCGNPLRRRVADAEWRFRRGTVAPIPEYALAEAANEVLTNAGAPSWARASVGELHLFRTAGRPELPRFIGTVESELRLSDRMSPVEAVFIAATLGKAMIHEPEEFRDGPETYLERIRERQRNPPPSPRLVVRIAPFDLTNDLRVENSVTAKAAHRFLDQLGFPR